MGEVDYAGPAGGGDVCATGLWRSQEWLDCVLSKAIVIANNFSHHFTTAVHEAGKYGKRRHRHLSRILRFIRGYQIWDRAADCRSRRGQPNGTGRGWPLRLAHAAAAASFPAQPEAGRLRLRRVEACPPHPAC